jgi:predicted hotdog family 3-hydroxylacyl-ACP dehydratase
MNRSNIRVEDLLPHRGRMKLVDKIIELDEERAVTRATVTDQWPFFDGKSVNALVLVELVAQTAGINNSWGGIKKQGDNFQKKGWLVGIKQSRFLIDAIPLDTCIITRIENQFKFENYREILGTAEMNSHLIGEVTLQLLQNDSC